ncbi:hypothetical protein EDD86DRAFT_54160 [Gorgonomyces haynaldii]|nr:hypothetical protein EDD86DRAFT_54160 [Gorgonomyces haynaldii]
MTLKTDLPDDLEDKIPVELLLGIMSMTEPPIIQEDAQVEDHCTQMIKLLRHKETKTLPMAKLHELGRQTWILDQQLEKRIHSLQKQVERAQLKQKQLLDAFDSVLVPLWDLDPEIADTYDEIATIWSEIQHIFNTPLQETSATERQSKIWQLQKHLHEIESKAAQGIFKTDNGMIPRGQAAVVSLLHRCYKKIHELVEEEPDVDMSLLSVYTQLDDINKQLKSVFEIAQETNLDNRKLKMLRSQLHDIESKMQDGKFLNEAGSVPPGQAILVDLLQENYDLVHCCTMMAEEAMDQAQQDKLEKLKEAMKQPVTTKDHLVDLMAPVSETMQLLKEAGSYTSKTLSAYTQSVLWYARKIASQLEPIDQSLEPLHQELLDILLKLKRMRQTGDIDQDLVEQLHDRLLEIELQKVNDQYLNDQKEAPLGQMAIQNLHDECYCVALEMMCLASG